MLNNSNNIIKSTGTRTLLDNFIMEISGKMHEFYDLNTHSVVHTSWNKWSKKSANISYKTNKKCIGNGEHKLKYELNISTSVGGQNSTADLIHPIMGKISVKDMTNDDCTLGTDGCRNMRKIFRTIINPFISWSEKHKLECKLANKYYNYVNKAYGSSRFTIIEGIDRFELSNSNLSKLNEILNKIKKDKKNFESQYDSLKSEYIDDIIINLDNNSLQQLLDECVRKEATKMKLIIVNEEKGWFIVTNTSKLSCPRITRGAPRIHYNFN